MIYKQFWYVYEKFWGYACMHLNNILTDSETFFVFK